MRYGTRVALGDQVLADVATLRGKEVERLRLALAAAERERDEALAALRQAREALAVATTPLAADRQEVLHAMAACDAQLNMMKGGRG